MEILLKTRSVYSYQYAQGKGQPFVLITIIKERRKKKERKEGKG